MSQWHREMERRLRGEGPLKGRYEIGEALGAGSYGMVLGATDRRSGEEVAIKLIPQAAAERSDTAVGRFRRELQVIRALDHPNIVTMLDWGNTEDGLIYMVLEYIEGRTLDEVVRHRPMGREVGLDTARQIALGVGAAHVQGVVHRDLKPANIMLVPRLTGKGYRVKILDFGMAKMVGGGLEDGVGDLTREGMAVGTPRYIAPEQARGKKVGPSSDLYAVGLLIYEIFTGVQAVEADSVRDAVNAHVSSHPLELGALDEVPVDIRSIIVKAVEKRPDKRFQSGEALAEALADPGEWARRRNSQRGGAGFGPALGDMTGDFPGASSDSEGQRKEKTSRRRQKRQRRARELMEAAGQPVDLELDEEVVERVKQERRKSGEWRQEEARERGSERWLDRWIRPPRGGAEWSEALLSAAVLVGIFLAIGAHFSTLDWGVRLGVAASLPLGVMVTGFLRGDGSWERSSGRLGWVVGVPVLAAMHLVNTEEMARELMRNPSWFLGPFSEVPGLSVVEAAVDWLGRNWAALILQIVGE